MSESGFGNKRSNVAFDIRIAEFCPPCDDPAESLGGAPAGSAAARR